MEGKILVSEAKRPKRLEADNGKLKNLLAEAHLDKAGPAGSAEPRMVDPQLKR